MKKLFLLIISILVLLFIIITAGIAATITTGSISSPLCAGSQVSVPFTANGGFNMGNIFTAQLSNASGSFTSPVNIGSIPGRFSAVITATIPKNTAQSALYRIRVIASSPSTIGSNNGSNLFINSSPSPAISGSFTVCQLSSQTYTVTNFVGPDTYKWKVNQGVIVGADSLSTVNINWLTPNLSGTITLIETNPVSGCKDSVFQSITLNPAPQPTISGSFNVCNRSTQQYSTTQTPGHTYLWSVVGGSISGANNHNTVTVFWNTLSASATLTLLETIFQTGCVATKTNMININPLPTPSINGEIMVCRNTWQTYSTPSVLNHSYKWKITGGSVLGDDTLSNITVNWKSLQPTGNITIIETNTITGCIDSNSRVVNILDKSTAVVDGVTKSCQGNTESYMASISQGVSFKWIVSGGIILGTDTTGTIPVLWQSNGSETVTLYLTTTTTGCVDTANYEVRIDPIPSPTIMGRDSTSKNSTIKYYVSNDILGDSYAWNVVGGELIGNPGQRDIKVLWTADNSGTVSVTESVDSTGCANSTSMVVQITFTPIPSFSGPNAACKNDYIDYYADVIEGCSYKWRVTGGIISGSDNLGSVQVQWLSAGSQTITMGLTQDSTGYKDSTFMVVKISDLPKPVIKTAANIACESNQYIYIGNASLNAYNKWTATGGLIIGKNNDTTVTLLWGKHGLGRLTYIQTNPITGCKDSTSKTINILPLPVPLITGNLKAVKGSTEHYSAQYVQGTRYNWQVEGGDIKSISDSSSVDIIWGNGNNGIITLSETTKDGCTDSNVVDVALIFPQGVDDSKSNEGIFRLYPNPVQNKLNIESFEVTQNNFSVKIINELGMTFIEQNIIGKSIEIDTKNYQTSTYFCIIKAGSRIETKKFVIIK